MFASRGRATPPPSSLGDELARLQARIDQTLALVRDAARCNSGNAELVDLALDVANTLRPQPQLAAKPSPRSR